MDNARLEIAINDSGFPLQMGLKRLAERHQDWEVPLSEHPWRDPVSGEDKYVDLVLKLKGDHPLRLIVECKRARETEWIFLREDMTHPGRNERFKARARVLARRGGGRVDEWVSLSFVPGSPEANYCVIRKGGQRSQELLERTAAEIVRATEALALQEATIHGRAGRAQSEGLGRVYLPVIVSTAKMHVCDADYGGLNLESGEVQNSSAAAVTVVRFAKSLGSPDPNARSIEEFAKQSERSVIIVQAAHFSDFLETWNLDQRLVPDGIRQALYGAV